MNKTIVFLLAFGFVTSNLHAQETNLKPQYIIGGSANFTIQNNTYPLSTLSIISGALGGVFSNSTQDSKNIYGSFIPRVARQVTDRWLLGLQINLAFGKYETEIQTPSTMTLTLERDSRDIGIGVFGRYALNPENKFQAFIRPSFSYNINNEIEKVDDQEIEENANYIQLGFGFGGLYKINERFNTTVNIGGINYVKGNWKIEGTETEKDFSSFNAGFSLASIFFGLEYKL